MFNWAKQQLAHVAGTQEPIYGPHAIQAVTRQAETVPYTELTKKDQVWIVPDSSCVETQTFYVQSKEGHIAFVQVIYSNVAISPTCQFNCQIYHMDGKTPDLWASDVVSNWKFGDEKLNFSGEGCSISLSEDGKTYTIKSTTNKTSVVNLKITRNTPGVVIGEDGTSWYGTDAKRPWGSMRHSFWPRCTAEGSVMTKSGPVVLDGRATYVHALQGMKPHHTAARWNFVNFQSPTYSAIMMEFTTPPSYASTVVNVGVIATDDGIVFAGANNTAAHTDIKGDPEVNWPEPSATQYIWKGKTLDGKDSEVVLAGKLGDRLARIDVMAELPGFIKQLASAAVGTRPYIYQYGPKMTIKVRVGDEEKEEEGQLFAEATFIS